ncbi:MAG: hypothetical protein R6V44_09195 [Paracoccaceae bacterium]
MTRRGADAPAAANADPPAREFLISRGGPFFSLQEQLGLLSRSALRSSRRAGLAVALAAGVPLALGAVLPGLGGPGAMLSDPTFLARHLIAIAICFAMEVTVETRLHEMLRRFRRTGVLVPAARPKLASAVATALRLRNDATAEAACLLLAIAVSAAAARWRVSAGEPSWALVRDGEGFALSPVGWWITVVSMPLLWFLILRWLWRYALWAWLLTRLAKLEMRLVATHPDRSGGIGFIGGYPNAFAMFAFALGSILAASSWSRLAGTEVDATAYAQLLSVWLVVVFGIFVTPLTAFARPLSRLRDETLVLCSRQETRRERAAELRTLSEHAVCAEEGGPAEGDMPDPKAFREAAQKLRIVPFSRAALLPLALAALAPLLVVGAALFNTVELLRIAKGLLVF